MNMERTGSKARSTAPVLVLGLEDSRVADGGIGQAILSRLSAHASQLGNAVEFLAGDAKRLALGAIQGRKAVLLLGAIRLGDEPGAVHVLHGEELAQQVPGEYLLSRLKSDGDVPGEIALIGIEPAKFDTEISLPVVVEASLGVAAGFARMTVNQMLASLSQPQPHKLQELICEEELVV